MSVKYRHPFLVGWEIKFIGRPPRRDKGEGNFLRVKI